MKLELRETLRLVVLNFLAPRHAGAFNAQQITDRLRAERSVDFPLEVTDVAEACDRLVKAGLAQSVAESSVSIVPHYQATDKGIMESEKWRLSRGLD